MQVIKLNILYFLEHTLKYTKQFDFYLYKLETH